MAAAIGRRCGRGALKWYLGGPPRHYGTSPANVGDCLGPGQRWRVLSRTPLPELGVETATVLHHRDCDAKLVHFAADDEIHAFSVSFKTVPFDSTGICHILEHVTLCGSERYPVRDPFFKMLNRSMSTFMNAMTGPDYTLYPFSSPSEKDYYNLMGVYCDAVFRPRLKEQDFRQEGWRLEQEKLTDPDSKLILKGVVFNEMKGVFADSQAHLGRNLIHHLLPR